MDIVRAQNCCFFIFTYLIKIEEKRHVPVTVHFPDYDFHESIHMYCFHKWDVFLIYLFLCQTQKLSNKSLLSLEKKNKLLPARFLVKFVMLPVQSIALANWLVCVPACTSAIAWVTLTSLPIAAWLGLRIVVLFKELLFYKKKAVKFIDFQPRNSHTSPLFKQNAILKFQDKICIQNILFGSRSLNNLTPSNYEISSST